MSKSGITPSDVQAALNKFQGLAVNETDDQIIIALDFGTTVG